MRAETMVRVTVEAPVSDPPMAPLVMQMPWGEFTAANEIEPEEAEEMERSGRLRLGGGAAPIVDVVSLSSEEA